MKITYNRAGFIFLSIIKYTDLFSIGNNMIFFACNLVLLSASK